MLDARDRLRIPASGSATGPGRWLALAGFIGIAQLAGLLGLPFTDSAVGSWYDGLDKAPFNPPSWVFAPVWTLLYVLVGVAAWLVWLGPRSDERAEALRWWGLQLLLNASWTPVFFGAESPTLALVVILALAIAVVVTIRAFAPVDRRAALLLLPYLAWIVFAAALNAWIVAAN